MRGRRKPGIFIVDGAAACDASEKERITALHKADTMSTPQHVHFLQHASVEDPAAIADWVKARGHKLTTTHLYRGEMLPDLGLIDWIVIMGGPMNVYEYRSHPWLRDEKRFIEAAIRGRKTLLGVCLGAQLLADVLGAKVYQNGEKEIGWFPVSFKEVPERVRFFPGVSGELTVFHWHGDTFDLPAGSSLIASSAGCANQAFTFGERIVGLQFHLESTPASVTALLEDEGELSPSRYVQSSREIAANRAHFGDNARVLSGLMEQLEKAARTK